VRSKFGKEWAGQIEFLKQEAYDGVSDIYFSDDHKHGYARLNAVLTQAVNTPIKKIAACQHTKPCRQQRKERCLSYPRQRGKDKIMGEHI
jgi:hypothetical protein